MNNINDKSVVLVCTDCINTRILYHGIKDEVPVSSIIAELPVEKKTLIKRRIKKFGIWKTSSQLFFQAGAVPVIKRLSAGRVKRLLKERQLDTSPLPAGKLINVPTVNGKEFIDAIQKLNPDLILVNGTRIISGETLSAIKCPIINVHVGITPLYRGVHGAYWALVNNDYQNCGVTVHAIDKGIDTGAILAQDIIEPGKEDNFITYPYLQFEKAISLVKKVVPEVLNNSFEYRKPPAGQSKLWYHPTIWQYLKNRFKGKK